MVCVVRLLKNNQHAFEPSASLDLSVWAALLPIAFSLLASPDRGRLPRFRLSRVAAWCR